jgi:DNA-binding NtrC family response regulator
VLPVPPLRERPADIPGLVALFADDGREGDGAGVALTEATMGYLLNYDWPGNVRELEQLIRRTRQSKGGGLVSVEDLPPQIRWFPGNRCDRRARAKGESGFNPLSEEFQFQLIADALRRTHVRRNHSR